MKIIPKSFFARETTKVAKALLGRIIEYKGVSGIITEVEAYKGPEDEASHAYKKTKRSEIMYDSYGRVYVYFIYGNHYCINFTTEKNKAGAVLIRAVYPIKGIDKMKKRRKKNFENLANGPGKLCQAFNINKELNGTEINSKLKLYEGINISKSKIKSSKRIGISKANDREWRFFVEEEKIRVLLKS